MSSRVIILGLVFTLTSISTISAPTASVPFIRTGAGIIVDVGVGGKSRHFLLDTGSGVTVLSLDAAGWSLTDLKKGGSSRLAVGMDGSTHSMGSTTATLQLGQALIVTPMAVADLHRLSKALKVRLDGILGQDVLLQFTRVTIDSKNNQLILEQ